MPPGIFSTLPAHRVIFFHSSYSMIWLTILISIALQHDIFVPRPTLMNS